jgi:hypothetical protein
VKGVTSCTNAVLHPWPQEQLTEILASLSEITALKPEANRCLWQTWQAGLSAPIELPDNLPPLRMFLIWDNLRGHYTLTFVRWLIEHGIMPLYTPIGGSWLNMAESMQRILVRRGLSGQNPGTTEQIISLLEEVAQGWNLDPTPFEWGGKRAARREEVINATMLWVAQAHALAIQSAVAKSYSNNGSCLANRPTSTLWRKQ